MHRLSWIPKALWKKGNFLEREWLLLALGGAPDSHRVTPGAIGPHGPP